MEISAIRLYELLKASVGTTEAQELIRVLRQEAERNPAENEQEIFLTSRQLRTEHRRLIRAIWLISVVQSIVIVASVAGLLWMLLKK